MADLIVSGSFSAINLYGLIISFRFGLGFSGTSFEYRGTFRGWFILDSLKLHDFYSFSFNTLDRASWWVQIGNQSKHNFY